MKATWKRWKKRLQESSEDAAGAPFAKRRPHTPAKNLKKNKGQCAAGKFLKESRGNFFQKVSFGASPLGVSFVSFSLRLRSQRKAGKDSDDGKERGTLRQAGGYGILPYGVRFVSEKRVTIGRPKGPSRREPLLTQSVTVGGGAKGNFLKKVSFGILQKLSATVAGKWGMVWENRQVFTACPPDFPQVFQLFTAFPSVFHKRHFSPDLFLSFSFFSPAERFSRLNVSVVSRF